MRRSRRWAASPRLVDGLLALARADAATPRPVPVDLRAAVAARADAWSPQLAEA